MHVLTFVYAYLYSIYLLRAYSLQSVVYPCRTLPVHVEDLRRSTVPASICTRTYVTAYLRPKRLDHLLSIDTTNGSVVVVLLGWLVGCSRVGVARHSQPQHTMENSISTCIGLNTTRRRRARFLYRYAGPQRSTETNEHDIIGKLRVSTSSGCWRPSRTVTRR